MLSSFPPTLASLEMETLQQQVDSHIDLTMHWRQAFGAVYARCDGQQSTTKLVYSILKLDTID